MFYGFVMRIRKLNHYINSLNPTGSTPGAGKRILRYASRYHESMVRLRCMCLIHPAKLLSKNGRQKYPQTTWLPPENKIFPKHASAGTGGYVKPMLPKLGGISSGRPCLQSAQDTLCHSQIGKGDPENNTSYNLLGI